MSSHSAEWDKKSRKTVDNILKHFAKYNLEQTCPYCAFKARMRDKFDLDTQVGFLGDKEHEARQCFVDDFMIHQIVNPAKESVRANKTDEELLDLANSRFDKIVELIKKSKR